MSPVTIMDNFGLPASPLRANHVAGGEQIALSRCFGTARAARRSLDLLASPSGGRRAMRRRGLRAAGCCDRQEMMVVWWAVRRGSLLKPADRPPDAMQGSFWRRDRNGASAARAIRQYKGPWEERGSCCARRFGAGEYILVL